MKHCVSCLIYYLNCSLTTTFSLISYVRCIYYVTQTIQSTSLRSWRHARTRARGKKRIGSVLYIPPSRFLQKLTIKLTGSYHAGCQGTLGDKNALHNTNSVIKGVCSIHSRLRSVYISLGLFLPSYAHLWTYTRERRPPLVPEVTHCGQSFTYFGLRISYRSVRTVSK